MGQRSGEVRAERAVEGAIAEDVARNAHPMVGPILDHMPELKKTLRKNPGLLDFALSKLVDMGEKRGSGVVPGTPSSTPNPNGRKING